MIAPRTRSALILMAPLFTHINDRVTFEVLAASFGIDEEPGDGRARQHGSFARRRWHRRSRGGRFEAVMTGAIQRGLSDDELLHEMSQMLDSLLAHFAAVEKSAAKRRR